MGEELYLPPTSGRLWARPEHPGIRVTTRAQVALKEMLALHDKGLSSQLVLEERQLYFRQVLKTLEDALGCPPPPADSAKTPQCVQPHHQDWRS